MKPHVILNIVPEAGCCMFIIVHCTLYTVHCTVEKLTNGREESWVKKFLYDFRIYFTN
jgi:hypothetical protein